MTRGNPKPVPRPAGKSARGKSLKPEPCPRDEPAADVTGFRVGVLAGRESYFGGKGSSFRHLVNQIPPHDWLIVPFAGHCAIARNIKPPARVWLIDKDPTVVAWWASHLEGTTLESVTGSVKSGFSVSNECGIKLLGSLNVAALDRAFIYLDPPYLMQTRKSGHRYQYEMSDAEHSRMLMFAEMLDCRIMISGYMSDMYAKYLKHWRHYSFQAATRRGMATEHVWCNYPQPTELQDYRWLGANKRERFKLLRRERNLIDKLNRLSDIERNALLAAVASHFGDTGSI